MTERELVPPVRAPADEETALRDSAIVVQREDRSRWIIRGPSATDVLNGLVTNDVAALKPGTGCYAAALTAKGKIIADLRVFALDDGFLIDTVTAAAPGLTEMFRKYVNPRLARVDHVTDETFDVAVAGPGAADYIQRVFRLDAAVADLPAHAHVPLPLAGRAHLVARTAELDGDAFDLLVAADEHARVYGLLTEAGAVPAGLSTWEVARIARGWPVWGKDMDENTLAQEASLDRLAAISYTKGCYTGQETVARVHFRGHVNRYLRRARFEAGEEIPRGAELVADDGRVVGDVRSSAITPSGGVAIAMVRRETADGTSVLARWGDETGRLSLIGD